MFFVPTKRLSVLNFLLWTAQTRVSQVEAKALNTIPNVTRIQRRLRNDFTNQEKIEGVAKLQCKWRQEKHRYESEITRTLENNRVHRQQKVNEWSARGWTMRNTRATRHVQKGATEFKRDEITISWAQRLLRPWIVRGWFLWKSIRNISKNRQHFESFSCNEDDKNTFRSCCIARVRTHRPSKRQIEDYIPHFLRKRF